MAPTNTSFLIRYGLTGTVALVLVAAPAALGFVAITPPSFVPAASVALVVGFLLDAASAYKAHPTYRAIRERFFLATARCDYPLDPLNTDEHMVQKGETMRESTLYSLPSERRDDLRIEHALWISTFHVHLILGASAVLLAGFSIAHAAQTGASQRAIVGFGVSLLYALLSRVFLGAAAGRLRSYNNKLVTLTRERTHGHYQAVTAVGLERLFAGLDDPASARMAFQFAAEAHEGQTRDDGEPYIAHPIRVALVLRNELGVDDSEILALALLHDVLESPIRQRPSVRALARAFGEDIAHDCRLLTEKPGTTREERDRRYAATLAGAGTRVRLVKVVDRLDNVRSLLTNPSRAKVRRYLEETDAHYVALAASTNTEAGQLLGEALIEARRSDGARRWVGKLTS